MTFGLAIAGLGTMGRVAVIAAAADPRWHIVGASDPDPEARAWLHDRVPQAPTFADSRHLVAHCGSGDVLAVMTPPRFHAPLAQDALGRGLHVLCEKPMATNATDAQQMLRAAHMAGAAEPDPKVLAVVDHQLRYNAARQWIRDHLERGTIGTPHHVLSVMAIPTLATAPWSWWSSRAEGGGVLNEFASHTIDLLQWWFGPCATATGTLRTTTSTRRDNDGVARPSDCDDFISAQLCWPTGPVADVLVSGTARPPRRVIEIHGEDGSIICDAHDYLTHVRRDGTTTTHYLREREASLLGDPDDTYTQPFARLLADIAGWLDGSVKTLHATTFDQALAVVQTLDAVRADSARPHPPIARYPL